MSLDDETLRKIEEGLRGSPSNGTVVLSRPTENGLESIRGYLTEKGYKLLRVVSGDDEAHINYSRSGETENA